MSSNDSQLKSLSDLFKDKMFRIPDYQRGYSWEKKQIDEFIDDLKIMDINNDDIHYTGMLSLKEFGDKEKENLKEKWIMDSDESITPFYVIDGQQRLITCTILINVIIDYFKKIEEEEKKQILLKKKTLKDLQRKYIFEEDPETSLEEGSRAYKLLYSDDNVSNEYLENAIWAEKENAELKKTLYTNNMLNAKEKFKKWIEEEGKKGPERIEEIFDKVTNKLKFNIYYIDKNTNVNISFETMNNRGKSLSNLELLKNRLIYLSTKMNNTQRDRNLIREDINDAWKTIYNTLGKNADIKVDDDEYLRHHWIIYFPYSRSQINEKQISYDRYLLDEYFSQMRIINQSKEDSNINSESKIEDRKDESSDCNDDDSEENKNEETLKTLLKEKLELCNIQNYVKSIKNMVKFWYQTKVPENEDLNEDVRNMLIKINRLKIAQVRPLTTVILSKYIKNKNDKEIVNVLKKLERFLFINFALRKVPSNYKDSQFYHLSQKLNKNEITLKNLCEYLEKIDDIDDKGNISLNEILPVFKKYFDKYEGFYSKSWKLYLKYFLYEYEISKVKNKKDTTIENPKDWFSDQSENTIEHIYPRDPEEKYGWIKDFEKYTDQQRHCFKNTLGNLLPLSKSVNSSLKNHSFAEKKERYQQGCKSEYEVSLEQNWTPESIVKRSLNLLDFMQKHWQFKFSSDDDKYKFLNLEFYIENTRKE